MTSKKNHIKGLNSFEKNDWSKAIACLTNAFSEDQCLEYLLGSEINNPEKARFMHEYTLKYGSLFGHVFTTSKNIEGVSIWLPPKSSNVSSFMNAWRFIRSGGLKLDKIINHGTIALIKKYGDYSSELHHRNVKVPHWYLMSIGVANEFQGQGFSKELIMPMIEYFDKNAQTCYLETHNPKNVTFYEKFGFKIMEIGILPDSNTTHWAMLREPK